MDLNTLNKCNEGIFVGLPIRKISNVKFDQKLRDVELATRKYFKRIVCLNKELRKTCRRIT